MDDDLRHLPDDSFQILTGDECVIIICCIAVLVGILYG
jgi:hypothetical protein